MTAAISQVQVASQEAFGSGSMTATFPGTCTAGNLLVWAIGMQGGGGGIVPTGFTDITPLPTTHLRVAYKISDGTETAVAVTGLIGSRHKSMIVLELAITGGTWDVPNGGSTVTNLADNETASTPAITPGVPSLVIHAVGLHSNSDYNLVFTTTGDLAGYGTRYTVALGVKYRESGTEPARVATWSFNRESSASTIAFEVLPVLSGWVVGSVAF